MSSCYKRKVLFEEKDDFTLTSCSDKHMTFFDVSVSHYCVLLANLKNLVCLFGNVSPPFPSSQYEVDDEIDHWEGFAIHSDDHHDVEDQMLLEKELSFASLSCFVAYQ